MSTSHREGVPSHGPAELDVVELTADTGRWPAGTPGTIVHLTPGFALVEIADDRGRTLDMLDIQVESLRRLS